MNLSAAAGRVRGGMPPWCHLLHYIYQMPSEGLLAQLTATPDAGSPVIRIFAEAVSPRFDFTCRFIFHTVLRVNFRVTVNPGDDVEVTYSGQPKSGTVHIIPDGLLVESNLRSKNPAYPLEAVQPRLSQDGVSFPVDLFSAVFYHVSRYEEWLPFKSDKHGRFEASSHSAEELTIPWVDRWIVSLRTALEKQFTDIAFPPLKLRQLATIDVDNLYAFRKKGFVRTLGGGFKDLLRGEFRQVAKRLGVALTGAIDSFDIYEKISASLHHQGVPLVYFFLYGGSTRYDRSVKAGKNHFGDAFESIRNYNAHIGIHPSYDTYCNGDKLKKEAQQLTADAGRAVIFSRMHYLRFDIRNTPKILMSAGIEADFTMGFASKAGFRAGTGYPFRYFDFESNAAASLVCVPFMAMDGAYTVYDRVSPAEAMRSLKALRSSMEPSGGWFVTVFHERTFSELHYPGFAEVFRELYITGTSGHTPGE
jgi:hypothetical protein